ncbi:uncharacterized protein LOC141525844 [Cotesia typhae]|uniref:uncharacterized protein LOC141525844 n=1 Tax=Cotesia typhae TaxID=2053667 RepID=UPI003D689FDD
MFAYIKLIDDDKYDTIPLSLVYNHEQLKLPYNKSKQHWIMYENNSPKKGLLIYVEETKEAIEKLISSKRPIVPAPRNQETASELSDANEGILRNKSDPVIDITPIVDQQLNQLHEKLAIIDNKTGNHDSDGKENLKPITNADNQNDDNLSKIITPSKREPTMKFDSSLAKTETVKEKKLKKSKKRKGDTGLPTETKSKKKKFRKTMIDKKLQQDKSVSSKTQKKTSEKTLTISHANHGNDSKQGSDEKPNHSTATKGIKREHNDEPTEIAEVGMRNFSQGKDQTENESKEYTKKIVHENSSQQQSKNEDGTSQTIDETADYNTNLLNDINKYLNDPPTVKVIDKGNIQQQHNVFDEASCSNTQTIKDKY